MNSKSFLILFILGLFVSCVPESRVVLKDIKVDLARPEVQRLVKHEIDQNRDSITKYAYSEDPTLRYMAARAFASFNTERAIPILDSLLQDPVNEIAGMAAYSLGQLRTAKVEKLLVDAFKPQDTSSVNNYANSNILEAIGKCGSAKMLDAMSSVSTYRVTDTLLLLGQVRALYQFANRGLVTENGTKKIIELINEKVYPDEVRLIAAHYLARPEKVEIEEYKFQITQALLKEDNPDIKMALASSLRKTEDAEVQSTLLDQLELEQDYRVKVNIIKALSSHDYIKGAEKVIKFLDDKNHHIALAATDFFIENGNKDDATVYRQQARDENKHWRVRAKLYYAVFKNLPYYYTKTATATRWELMKIIEQEENPFAKASYISALSNDPGSYADVYALLEDEENQTVRSSIYQVLSAIVSHPEFNQSFQTTRRYVRGKILSYINEALESNDPGEIAIVGDIISNAESGMKDLIDSTSLLETALDELNLPRDIEAYHSLERALAHLKGVNDPILTKVDSKFNPDFSLLELFKDKRQVIVKTNKGVFNIELMPEAAPISVLNFLQLVQDGYYNDKASHRVVPNFVVQAGCNRGDGYGSMNYVIRSEVGPLHYDKEGYVGYASAGLHTESSQWFVTHSPTPHLDGKYSIFGKVVEGMDVVHQLEIGDQILDVIIKTI